MQPQMSPINSSDNLFHDGNPLTGIKGTIVTAEWLNAVQASTRDIQAELIAILTASALAPDDTAGQLLAAIRKLTMSRTNPGADLVTDGSVPTFLQNLGLGTGLTGVVGHARNLEMSLATAGTTAAWTADELITETALGGTQYKLSNVTLPIDLSVVGAGGVDVAGTVPTNGYLATYAISGPGKTPAALGCNATTAAAPEVYAGGAMPAGYTASALISVWRIVNGQLIAGWQKERRIKFLPFMVLASSIQAAEFTSLNLSACVPQNAKFISGYGNPNISGTGYNTNMALASTAEGIGAQIIGCGGAAIVSPFSDLEVAISQTIYYTLTSSTSLQTSYIYISGYEF